MILSRISSAPCSGFKSGPTFPPSNPSCPSRSCLTSSSCPTAFSAALSTTLTRLSCVLSCMLPFCWTDSSWRRRRSRRRRARSASKRRSEGEASRRCRRVEREERTVACASGAVDGSRVEGGSGEGARQSDSLTSNGLKRSTNRSGFGTWCMPTQTLASRLPVCFPRPIPLPDACTSTPDSSARRAQ
jgi:hypothetical protein